MFLIYKMLKTRTLHKELFQNGSYIPLKTGGNYKDHIVAHLRKNSNSQAIIVVPRFFTGLIKEGVLPLGKEVWLDTFVFVPKYVSGIFRNVITNETLKVEEKILVSSALKRYPEALFINGGIGEN